MQLMVIQDSDNLKLGNLEAKVGMELANGYTVIKVNEKSVIAEHDGHTEKFFHPTSIFYTEATRWGFTCSKVDVQTERLAAIKNKFAHGERKFKLYHENGYVLPLSSLIEQAGYDFAKEMQAKRELTIAELLNQSGVETQNPEFPNAIYELPTEPGL